MKNKDYFNLDFARGLLGLTDKPVNLVFEEKNQEQNLILSYTESNDGRYITSNGNMDTIALGLATTNTSTITMDSDEALCALYDDDVSDDKKARVLRSNMLAIYDIYRNSLQSIKDERAIKLMLKIKPGIE